jgi:hypothetical protein
MSNDFSAFCHLSLNLWMGISKVFLEKETFKEIRLRGWQTKCD